MPNISLPTGNVIYISTYEYFFVLKDEDMDEFYQQLIAENAGVPAPDNPFSNKASKGNLEEVEELPEIEELPDIDEEF